MTKDLVSINTPQRFWRLRTEIDHERWAYATERAKNSIEWPFPTPATVDELLDATLAEGQFGPDRYKLSKAKTVYYRAVRPVLPSSLRPLIRALVRSGSARQSYLRWPIEDRFVRFQRAVIDALLERGVTDRLEMDWFWPDRAEFAVCLTHDVEAQAGHDFIPTLVALEERYGFHSSFNFVPADYRVDPALLQELRDRGFEIGVHGYTHDGRLFSSRDRFDDMVPRINHTLESWGATGFRSPLTHRQPDWMQELEIEYDLSFFDTDPFEPMPGGTMSIWPFMLGRFVELPYTLPQDHTLFELGERTSQIWQEKAQFIRDNNGLVLVNVHPDYLRDSEKLGVYEEFLAWLNENRTFWHALPREVAARWRARIAGETPSAAEDVVSIERRDGGLYFDLVQPTIDHSRIL